MHPDGRKIPSDMENPIDNVLIYVATFLNRTLMAPLRIHPNWVTVASICIGLSASYFLFRSWFLMAGVSYFVAYFLDCVDGNLARMTNRVTKLGDALDHVGDMAKIGAMTVTYVTHRRISLLLRTIFGIGSGILFLLTMIHLACQEKEVHDSKEASPFLTIARCIAPIGWTRWVGSGTFISFQTLMILFSKKI